MDEKIVCAHPPCTCSVKSAGEYCSKKCEESRGKSTCSCGHSGCGGESQ